MRIYQQKLPEVIEEHLQEPRRVSSDEFYYAFPQELKQAIYDVECNMGLSVINLTEINNMYLSDFISMMIKCNWDLDGLIPSWEHYKMLDKLDEILGEL